MGPCESVSQAEPVPISRTTSQSPIGDRDGVSPRNGDLIGTEPSAWWVSAVDVPVEVVSATCCHARRTDPLRRGA
jgi:hypothetical protein